MLKKYWKWYDELQEPKRFFVAMLMLSPWFLGVISTTPIFMLMGGILVSVILISRWL